MHPGEYYEPPSVCLHTATAMGDLRLIPLLGSRDTLVLDDGITVTSEVQPRQLRTFTISGLNFKELT